MELADRIAEFHPRWLEECVMPDRVDGYRRIKERTQIPLSGVEQSIPAGDKRFIDLDALDALQPDIHWAGGCPKSGRLPPMLRATTSW